MKLTGTAERIAERARLLLPYQFRGADLIGMLINALSEAVGQELDSGATGEEAMSDRVAALAIAKINRHFDDRRRAAGG